MLLNHAIEEYGMKNLRIKIDHGMPERFGYFRKPNGWHIYSIEKFDPSHKILLQSAQDEIPNLFTPDIETYSFDINKMIIISPNYVRLYVLVDEDNKLERVR